MPKESSHSRAIRQTVIAWLTSLRGRLVILGTLVFTVVSVVAKELIKDAIIDPLKGVINQIPEWAAQPIGVYGLGLLAFLGLWTAFWIWYVLIMAWWENRPKKAKPVPKPEKTAPRLLTPDERNSIEAARILWSAVGKPAAGHIEWALLEPVREELLQSTRLATLLWHPLEELRSAREHLDYALYDHSQVPLHDVTGRLERAFKAYMISVRWLHECADSHGIRLETGPRVEAYQEWQGLHEKFLNKLTELSLRSDYSNLRFLVSHDDNRAIRFKTANA